MQGTRGHAELLRHALVVTRLPPAQLDIEAGDGRAAAASAHLLSALYHLLDNLALPGSPSGELLSPESQCVNHFGRHLSGAWRIRLFIFPGCRNARVATQQ